MWNSIGRTAFLAVALAWAGAAFAQAGGGDGTPLSSKRIEGRVQNVDPHEGTLTLRAKGDVQPQKIDVGRDTRIVKDGLNTSIADVRPGDDVRASFLNDNPTHAWQLEVPSQNGKTAPWGVGE